MRPYRLAWIKRTCLAMPSQWYGETVDGQGVYVRYRHGWFAADVGPGADQYVSDPVDWLNKSIGGEWDGDMTIGEMRDVTAGFLDFSDAKIEDNYPL